MPPEYRTALREGFELFEKPFTKALHDKGARLMAGTDALVPVTISGFSLHRELEELVGVGLTPYEHAFTANDGLNWRSLVGSGWEAFICVGLCVGLLALFREWFNKPQGKLLSAMAGASYGAYIIHLLLVMGVQAALHAVNLPPIIKFVVVTLIAAAISFGTAHLVRQIPGVKKVL